MHFFKKTWHVNRRRERKIISSGLAIDFCDPELFTFSISWLVHRSLSDVCLSVSWSCVCEVVFVAL